MESQIEATITRKKPFNLSLKNLFIISFVLSTLISLFSYSPILFIMTLNFLGIAAIIFNKFSLNPKTFAIAFLLSFLLALWARNGIDSNRVGLKGQPILFCVAKSDIPKGTKITSEHITYRSMPLEYKPSNAYFWTDRSQLFGLISTKKIKGRDYFMDNQFKK